MDQRNRSSPLPVDGIVFERSGGKAIVIALGWGFFFFLGICLLSGLIAGKVKKTDEGWVVGIGLALFAPVMIAREARSWRARRRLIVGQDRIQVVERCKGEDHVLLQIPYANIAEYKYEVTAYRVGIDLNRLDDAETYAPLENFRRNKKSDGRHYCITFGYRGGAVAIASEIEKAYRRWRSHSHQERGNAH